MTRVFIGLLVFCYGFAVQGTAKDTIAIYDNWGGRWLDTIVTWEKMAPEAATGRLQQAAETGSAYTTSFTITNLTKSNLNIGVFLQNRVEFIELCLAGGLVDTCLYNGLFQPKKKRTVLEDHRLIYFAILSSDTVHVTLSVGNVTRATAQPTGYLLNERSFLNYLAIDAPIDKRGFGISLLFLGAALVLMLYTLFLYFQNRKEKLYLYYSGYLFFAIWYFAQKVAIGGPFFILYPNQPLIGFVLNEPLQFGIYIFYNAFILSILTLRRHAPQLARLIYGVNIIYFLYALFDLLYMSFTLDGAYRDVMYVVSRGVVILVSIYLLIQVVRKSKSPLLPYIILGTFFFMVFSIMAMLFSLYPQWNNAIPLFPINWMHIGIFLEALFFSLAIGYRIRLNTVERQRYYRAYADQLRENQKLIEQTNKELNQKVEERTKEIVAQTKALEQAKAEQLKSEYERKVLESDLNTLRLQMNPHFIFNSLNSIRYYILKQDTPKAAEFIADFARLLRMVLHHSKQKYIRLSEEIEALDLYLSFEQERLSNHFSYAIDVDPDVEVRNLAIQPLLVQPFAENAIWHGLSPLQDREGELTISITEEGERIRIEVCDNGIGRTAAEERSKQERKSYGLEITKQRMEALNRIEGSRQTFMIEDLYDKQGAPSGTKVVLWLRKQLFQPEND